MAKADAEFITGKPTRIPKALRKGLEAAIEAHLAAVEKLSAVLDQADGDPDREPSLGAQDPAWANTDQQIWARSNSDDREGDEHDGREPSEDPEPSEDHEPCLGALNPDPDRSQTGWAEKGQED